MPAYIRKSSGEVLNEALMKIQKNTPITAISRGSIVRAIVEAVSTELGDLYEVMDFNLNQNLLSTATGSALDLIGALYDVERKTINNLEALDKQLGSFLFYIQSPVGSDIRIPKGTNVYTNATSSVGQRFSYKTSEEVIIPAGRTRSYAALTPNFTDSVFTAGPNTLTLHDFPSPPGSLIYCTNPKEIAQQVGHETDDAYRVRIIKKIRVDSKGTDEALRFAVLGVTGVRDVRLRRAPYGMGSVEVLVVPERNGSVDQVMAAVNRAAESVRPTASRVFIKTPTTRTVNMTVDLIMPGASSADVSSNVTKRATVGISRYVNSLLPGNSLVYNRLISIIIDSSEIVKDAIIRNLNVDGVEIMRRNFQPSDDEQLIPGTITVRTATA